MSSLAADHRRPSLDLTPLTAAALLRVQPAPSPLQLPLSIPMPRSQAGSIMRHSRSPLRLPQPLDSPLLQLPPSTTRCLCKGWNSRCCNMCKIDHWEILHGHSTSKSNLLRTILRCDRHSFTPMSLQQITASHSFVVLAFIYFLSAHHPDLLSALVAELHFPYHEGCCRDWSCMYSCSYILSNSFTTSSTKYHSSLQST